MYITISTIATAMRQGFEDKCEVAGQDSFASTNACRLRVAFIYVCDGPVAGHRNVEVTTLVMWPADVAWSVNVAWPVDVAWPAVVAWPAAVWPAVVEWPVDVVWPVDVEWPVDVAWPADVACRIGLRQP